MEKPVLSAFTIVLLVISGIFYVNNSSFGSAKIASSPKPIPLTSPAPTRVATAIADNVEVGRPLQAHDMIAQLPNGTLCATFYGDPMGTNSADYADYVISSNDGGATWGIPNRVSGTINWTIDANGTLTTKEISQGGFAPVIAADANNNVYVAWTGWTGNVGNTTAQIFCATYNGSAWTPATQVSQSSEPGLNAELPNIAVDGTNKVHLVWCSSISGSNTHDFEHTRIFYAQYNGTWSIPTVISTVPKPVPNDFNYNPCIAIDFNNNLHVVWSSYEHSIQGSIWYTQYNGTWQTPISITTSAVANINGANFLQAPSIAIDSNNYIHVVWQGTYDRSLRTDQIWYMNHTTSWSNPTRISNVSSMNSSDQQYPAIAVDSNNRIHVAWTSTRENILYYSRYDSSWSTPVQIEEYKSVWPHFAWSTFPSSNRVNDKLEYIFLRNSTLMFNSLSPSELPPGPPFTVSVTPISEIIGVGQLLQFASTVNAGISPYSYQWYIDDIAAANTNSSSWTFKPNATGTYFIHVAVTDSENNSAQSEIAQIRATSEFIKGFFGYSTLGKEGAGSGSSHVAYGSQFTLNVEANITSMSALMSTYPPQGYTYADAGKGYPATYGYRFAIYNDNNGSASNLIAQTNQGAAPVGRYDIFYGASFPSPVHLMPGAYWLMEVSDAPTTEQPMILGTQTNDYNSSVSCNIWVMEFPNSLPSFQPWLGHLFCIYASWEINNPQTVPQGENLFAVSTNSTVSSLAYNSTTNELSFTVTGPNGTTGYTQIYISKTLLQNPDGLTASIDGAQVNFTVSSIDDFWVLYFVYHHSIHNVAISMPFNAIPELPPWIILPVAVVATTLVAVLVRKKKQF